MGFLDFPGSSAGKESACNVGDLGSIPGLGRSPGEGKGYPLQSFTSSVVKKLPANAEDVDLTPRLRRSPGEENGNPF